MIIHEEILKQISGYISKKNMEILQKYILKLLKERPNIVVADIGSLGGLSAMTMAVVSEGVSVLMVEKTPESKEVIEHVMKLVGVENRCRLYSMDEIEFAREHCPELDACFLDAAHQSKLVDVELDLIARKVKKDGYIMIHDNNLYNYSEALKKYEGKIFKFIEEEPQNIDPKTNRPHGTVYVAQRI